MQGGVVDSGAAEELGDDEVGVADDCEVLDAGAKRMVEAPQKGLIFRCVVSIRGG